MEVVQALGDEEGESAERALGVDLSEVQFQIVGAAHVVVVGAHISTTVPSSEGISKCNTNNRGSKCSNRNSRGSQGANKT